MEFEEKLKNLKIPKEKVLYQEPMKKHTTFKIGGPAQCFIKIEKKEELKEILNLANQNSIPITIIGNGSNILVLDKGIKGITLQINIEKIEIQEKNEAIQITVGAGEKLGKLARNSTKKRNNRTRRTIWYTRNHWWCHSNECRSSWQRNERHCKNGKMYRLSRTRKRI